MSSVPDGAGMARPTGPVDRETFYKAQSRNRRATWRMTALCVVSAFIMGVPLTLVITPLFYAGSLIVLEIVNYFSALPQEFWDNANSLGRLAVAVGDHFFNGKPLDTSSLVLGSIVVLAPGMVITFLMWVAMQALLRRGGVGGTLAALNAREPNKNDLKELQLADVVEEMSIAAGLATPKVMLVDSPGANAAAIGTSPADARLVISRRLLDDLDRDQLQAILADLIGSVGNGDLSVAFTVTSVFETCGLIVTLINSPFGKKSRGALWRLVRYSFSRSSTPEAQAAEAEAVAALLAGNLDMGSDDISRFFDTTEQKKSLFRKLLTFIFFPFIFTNMAVELTLWYFLNIVLGPCMALVWRTRRYLADATAIQLTRNPDALAGALQRLSQDQTTVPGGAFASHLFVMNPKTDRSAGDAPTPEQMRQVAEQWTRIGGGAAPPAVSTPADFRKLRMQMAMTALAAVRGDPAAAARMQAFAKIMAETYGGPDAAQHIPNFADFAAAKQGDPAALARIRALSEHEDRPGQSKHGQTGLQAQSALSFHPPLKRRLKRLNRMGAHALTPVMSTGTKIVMGVLFTIIGPLLLGAAAMMLVVIGMMIMLNLVFLAIWLTAIHGIFQWLIHR